MTPPLTLSEAALAFVAERRYASLTTLRPDGSPHVTPVGFTWDPDRALARVITWSAARKARNVAARPGDRAVLCQLDGGRWLTVEGPATLSDDPDRVEEAVRRYAERYRPPRPRPDRVVIEIAVDRVVDRV